MRSAIKNGNRVESRKYPKKVGVVIETKRNEASGKLSYLVKWDGDAEGEATVTPQMIKHLQDTTTTLVDGKHVAIEEMKDEDEIFIDEDADMWKEMKDLNDNIDYYQEDREAKEYDLQFSMQISWSMIMRSYFILL